MPEILIVDDDELYCDMLSEHIQQAGHGVSLAHSLSEGRQNVAENDYDIVFLDLRLPDGSGLEMLPELKTCALPPEVIIVTGFSDAQSAELAIQHGAWDYVQKQSSIQVVMLSLSRAVQYRESRSAVASRVAFYAPELVGHSHPFRACLNMAAQAAGSDVNVLVTGETGTGKDLFARAVHENSPRAMAPFVVVDCTALPENLIGSILFGHEKGAFTGAEQKNHGLVQQADGGTLFLDEIGDMPLEIQKTFLRVLQERRFRPLGAPKEITSNFRLIAATNRDLDRLAQEDRFRKDLLFRLRAMAINLPPMRNRMDDVDMLAVHFVNRECALRGGQVKGIAEDFSEALRAYTWPGNVRELANAVAAAVAHAGQDPVLYAAHLPSHIRLPLLKAAVGAHATSSPAPPPSIPSTDFTTEFGLLRDMRDQFEKNYLEEMIRRANGNIETACQISGLSRPHVYSLLKKHKLKMR